MDNRDAKISAGTAASRRAALRGLARDLVPPLALKLARQLRLRARRLPAEWEVLPGGFEQARRDAKIKGWNQQPVLDVYARDLQQLRARLAAGVPLGLRDVRAATGFGELFEHNLAMTWGWVVARAAGRDSALKVLDWGGALGHYYEWARLLRPDLTLDYTVKEMPLFVEKAAALAPQIKFRGDDGVLDERFDLVVVAGAFHYEEHWQTLLPRLLGAATRTVFLQRIPLSFGKPGFVYVQRPYAYGYQTEYPCWCFNRAEFTRVIEASGWQIEREVVTGERVEIVGTSEVVEYRGFLLQPN